MTERGDAQSLLSRVYQIGDMYARFGDRHRHIVRQLVAELLLVVRRPARRGNFYEADVVERARNILPNFTFR
jgi:hypothetical protein